MRLQSAEPGSANRVPVAQWTEQPPSKRPVAGSNPAGDAIVLSRDIVDACLTTSWTSVGAVASRDRDGPTSGSNDEHHERQGLAADSPCDLPATIRREGHIACLEFGRSVA